MSTQDAVSTGNRKTTSRRVKFGATLEDLEGRVLLSVGAPSPASPRGSCASAASPPCETCRSRESGQPRTGRYSDANDARSRATARNTTKAIATAMINVQPRSTSNPRSMFNPTSVAELQARRAHRIPLRTQTRARHLTPAGTTSASNSSATTRRIPQRQLVAGCPGNG